MTDRDPNCGQPWADHIDDGVQMLCPEEPPCTPESPSCEAHQNGRSWLLTCPVPPGKGCDCGPHECYDAGGGGCLIGTDLPGMWEEADLSGGQADMRVNSERVDHALQPITYTAPLRETFPDASAFLAECSCGWSTWCSGMESGQFAFEMHRLKAAR